MGDVIYVDFINKRRATEITDEIVGWDSPITIFDEFKNFSKFLDDIKND